MFVSIVEGANDRLCRIPDRYAQSFAGPVPVEFMHHARALDSIAIRSLSIVAALVVAGCSDSDEGSDDTGRVDRDATADAGGDAGGPVTANCLELAAGLPTFNVGLGGAELRINPSAAFDGERLFVVYNTRGTADDFDIWLSVVACDGTELQPAIQLDSVVGPNVIEPQISRGQSSIAVVWQADNGTGENNLDIYLRMLDLNGAPLSESETLLEMTRGGARQSGNAWMPALTAADDGFVLAGAWGHDDAIAFQAFTQAISADGTLVGDAQDTVLEPAVGQVYPSVASQGVRQLMTWSRTPVEGDESIQLQLSANGTALNAVEVVAPAAGTAAVAFGETAMVVAWGEVLAGGSAVYLGVVNADGTLGAAAQVSPPSDSRGHFSPTVTFGNGDSGAIVWYRNISGFRNDVFVAPFEVIQGGLDVGVGVQVNEGPAAPYSPALIHLGQDYWFIADVEGANPAFEIEARVLELR
jgi:hypothetical protein